MNYIDVFARVLQGATYPIFFNNQTTCDYNRCEGGQCNNNAQNNDIPPGTIDLTFEEIKDEPESR